MNKRIKIAIRDHIRISMIRMSVHKKLILWISISTVIVALVFGFIWDGIIKPNVESDWTVVDRFPGPNGSGIVISSSPLNVQWYSNPCLKLKNGDRTKTIRQPEGIAKMPLTGDIITLMDHGWFCSGKHFVKYTSVTERPIPTENNALEFLAGGVILVVALIAAVALVFQ